MLETATGPWKTFRIECIQYVYNTACQNLSLKWIEALLWREREEVVIQDNDCYEIIFDNMQLLHVASWIRTHFAQVRTKLQFVLYACKITKQGRILKSFQCHSKWKYSKCGLILFRQQMHCKYRPTLNAQYISSSLGFQHKPQADDSSGKAWAFISVTSIEKSRAGWPTHSILKNSPTGLLRNVSSEQALNQLWEICTPAFPHIFPFCHFIPLFLSIFHLLMSYIQLFFSKLGSTHRFLKFSGRLSSLLAG